MFSSPNAAIHLRYIIGILLAVILGLVCIKITPHSDAVSYISFAATLSSLILAILAIVYAFGSNSGLTTSIAKLSNIAQEIEGSGREIIRVAGEIPNHMEGLQKELGRQGGLISDKLSTLGRTVQDEIPKAAADDATQKITVDKKAEAKRQIEVILKSKTSINGYICLFACAKAYKMRQSISATFIESLKLQTAKYWHGFIVGLGSVGVMTGRLEEGAINISFFPEVDEGAFKARALELAQKADNKKKEDDEENPRKKIVSIVEEILKSIEDKFQ